MAKTFISILLVLILFCSPIRVYLDKDYKSFDGTNKKFAIVFTNPIKINYKGSVKEEFGDGNQDTLINGYILSQLRIDIKDSTCLRYVKVDSVLNRDVLSKQYLRYKNKNDEFSMLLPSSGSMLKLSEDYDFTFFLEDFSVSSSLNLDIPNFVLSPIFWTPRKPLIFTSKFVIWDNKGKKIVAHGFAYASKSKTFVVDREIWDLTSAGFIHSVFKRTSFYHWRYH